MIKEISKRFIRFLIVGCLNTIVGFSLIFFFLNVLEAGYFLSTIIGYAISSVISFLLNRSYTFRHQGRIVVSYLKFIIVFAISYILSYVGGRVFIHLLEKNIIFQDVHLLQNLSIVFGAGVYLLSNYIGNVKLTFRD